MKISSVRSLFGCLAPYASKTGNALTSFLPPTEKGQSWAAQFNTVKRAGTIALGALSAAWLASKGSDPSITGLLTSSVATTFVWQGAKAGLSSLSLQQGESRLASYKGRAFHCAKWIARHGIEIYMISRSRASILLFGAMVGAKMAYSSSRMAAALQNSWKEVRNRPFFEKYSLLVQKTSENKDSAKISPLFLAFLGGALFGGGVIYGARPSSKDVGKNPKTPLLEPFLQNSFLIDSYKKIDPSLLGTCISEGRPPRNLVGNETSFASSLLPAYPILLDPDRLTLLPSFDLQNR